MKHTHTYHNIKRDNEFCINFLPADYIENCKESIRKNEIGTNEITNSGFTFEKSVSIKPPRIKESFLKLECKFEWEKELCPNSFNITVCGRIKHISVDEKFAKSSVTQRYGGNSFIFHLTAMKDPYTGERIRGGIGKIELIREMEL